MHLDEGEPGGTVDRGQGVELALFGAHFRDIEMKVADRMGFEFFAPGTAAVDAGQPGDIVPLQAAVQRRAGQRVSSGIVACRA